MLELQSEPRETHGYVADFISIAEMDDETFDEHRFVIDPARRPHGAAPGSYNLPAGAGLHEISMLYRDHAARTGSLAVRQRGDGKLDEIPLTNRACDPLHFVLLFPRGTDGWFDSIPLCAKQKRPASDDNMDIDPTSLLAGEAMEDDGNQHDEEDKFFDPSRDRRRRRRPLRQREDQR